MHLNKGEFGKGWQNKTNYLIWKVMNENLHCLKKEPIWNFMGLIFKPSAVYNYFRETETNALYFLYTI